MQHCMSDPGNTLFALQVMNGGILHLNGKKKNLSEVERENRKKVEEGHWAYCVEKCRKYQKIIVFGFTYYGRMFCDWLLNNGFESKLIICDNDLGKRGEIYEGVRVVALDEVEKEGALFINCSQRRNAEVTKMLLESAVARENIFTYIHSRKVEHYQYLDKKYYLLELKDIFYRERGCDMYGFKEDLYEMQRELWLNSEYQEWHDRYNMKTWILKGDKYVENFNYCTNI